MTERSEDDVEIRHRETRDDARRQSGAEAGLELPASDYEDESGVTDLGVEEPRVAEDRKSTTDSS